MYRLFDLLEVYHLLYCVVVDVLYLEQLMDLWRAQ